MPEHSLGDVVYVGEISKPHGVRGEISLHFVAESPEILLGDVFIEPPSIAASARTNNTALRHNTPKIDSFLHKEVEKIRYHHKAILVTLKGVCDRDEAEKYRRFKVYISRKKLPELSDEEYYLADMLNLSVLVLCDGNKQKIGHITSIDAPAGQELWTILSDQGYEILFPAVPEFVHDINLDEGIVIITPPPGLLELYSN